MFIRKKKNKSGRTVINEVLYINKEVREILKKNKFSDNVKIELMKSKNIDFLDFLEDIKEKVKEDIIKENYVYNFIE